MEQPPTRASDSASTGARETRPAETDGLAGFPSEGRSSEAVPSEAHRPERESLFGPHVLSPPVEPSEADRRRVFHPARRRRFPSARVSRAAVRVGGPLVVAAGVAVVATIVVLDVFVPRSIRSWPEVPVRAGRVPLAGAIPLPAQEVVSSIVSSPATQTPPPTVRTTPPPLPRRDVAVASESRAVTRPTPVRVTSPPPSAPIWPPAFSMARAASSGPTTPIDTLAPRTSVSLPVSPPPTRAPVPEAALSSPEAPPASTPAVAARAARTESARSVVDRYRDAFNALDANAFDSFWPGVDHQALKKTFAQVESQHLQFGRCEVQLAGARAFASCDGYAQYTKTGSRDPRVELKRWTFTLGEVKDGWVILGVDARQVR